MGFHLRLRRYTQAIADLAGKPWSQLRILDLGSLDGCFALEFAAQGAHVVGIEGREGNNALARGAATSMGLTNIEFVTDDVRNFTRERFGMFDVVVCSGILYHLPGEDGCRLIRAVAEACSHLTIIDTHVGQAPEVSVSCNGRVYYGDLFREHDDEFSPEKKLERIWASLDNNISFWITRPSLLNLLRDVGFSSVSEVQRPQSDAGYSDRITFAAIKGERQTIVTAPGISGEPDWPEISDLAPYPRLPIDAPLYKPVPRWKCIAGDIKRKLWR